MGLSKSRGRPPVKTINTAMACLAREIAFKAGENLSPPG
jgi:hypothetical protein